MILDDPPSTDKPKLRPILPKLVPLNFVIEPKSPKASKKSPNTSKKLPKVDKKSPNTSKKLPKVDKKSLKEGKKKRRIFVDDDIDFVESTKDVSNLTLDPENFSHPEKEENYPAASAIAVIAQTSSATADKSKSSTTTAEPSKNSSKATAAETTETPTKATTAASQNHALSLTELSTSSKPDDSKQQELFSLTESAESLAMLPQASSTAKPQGVKAKTSMLSVTTKSKSFTSAMSSNSATSSPVVRSNHIPMQLASSLSTLCIVQCFSAYHKQFYIEYVAHQKSIVCWWFSFYVAIIFQFTMGILKPVPVRKIGRLSKGFRFMEYFTRRVKYILPDMRIDFDPNLDNACHGKFRTLSWRWSFIALS